MDNLGVGLILMLVGMTTVFIILLIVIYLGKYLILLVNKFAPPEQDKSNRKSADSNDDVMSAVRIAVDKITDGRARVVKIEKL